MECQICSTLEAIRCDRIMKYVRLVEQLKRSKRLNAKLEVAISNLRVEADEAWKRLAAHRQEHASKANAQRCHYCGVETLSSKDGRTICELCAADFATARKPPQREQLDVKAKAATAT